MDNRAIEPAIGTLEQRKAAIEKAFTDCVMDLKEVIVLEDTGILAAETGFTILQQRGWVKSPSVSGSRFW